LAECTLWSLGPYEGLLKQCITTVKARGHKALAVELAEFAAERAYAELKDQGPINAIFAVPASQQGQRFRGFSLPQIMETKLAEKSGWPSLEQKLRRVYRSSTKNSQGLTKGDRLQRNQAMLTDVDKRANLGTLLLLDDVVTTGATLGRCVAQATMQGFENVVCFALAELPPE